MRGMLIRRITGWCSATATRPAARALGWLSIALWCWAPAFARQENPQQVPGPSLTEAGAMEAFQRVRDWAARGEVGNTENLPIARLASVVIRLDGRVVGKAWSEASEGALADAARHAIASAHGAMPKAKDLISETAESPSREALRVSIELAPEMTPISPRTYDDVDRDLAPGLDGVAVRIGEHFEAVFPESMLVLRLSPGDALSAAVARAANDPTVGLRVDPKGQPADIARERGAVFYRFRTVQVADIGRDRK